MRIIATGLSAWVQTGERQGLHSMRQAPDRHMVVAIRIAVRSAMGAVYNLVGASSEHERLHGPCAQATPSVESRHFHDRHHGTPPGRPPSASHKHEHPFTNQEKPDLQREVPPNQTTIASLLVPHLHAVYRTPPQASESSPSVDEQSSRTSIFGRLGSQSFPNHFVDLLLPPMLHRWSKHPLLCRQDVLRIGPVGQDKNTLNSNPCVLLEFVFVVSS